VQSIRDAISKIGQWKNRADALGVVKYNASIRAMGDELQELLKGLQDQGQQDQDEPATKAPYVLSECIGTQVGVSDSIDQKAMEVYCATDMEHISVKNSSCNMEDLQIQRPDSYTQQEDTMRACENGGQSFKLGIPQ